MGVISSSRKVKLLIHRWLAKAVNAMVPRGDPLQGSAIIIQQNTIVIVKVKVGRGDRFNTVLHCFHVVNIFDKYYNKWFMLKEIQKLWRKESKQYKLELRMLEKNALNEYVDVSLIGNTTFNADDICKIVLDREVVSVVGKMQESV